MKVLHAFSNWKWTGPAEPAVRLAAELSKSHEVAFACGACPYPDLENRVAAEARARGLEVLSGLRLRKHFDPLTGARDLARLTRIVRERRFDVVHTHLLNDHLLAGAAARRAGTGATVLRTVYGHEDLAPGLRVRLAFGRLADGVIAASDAVAAALAGGGADGAAAAGSNGRSPAPRGAVGRPLVPAERLVVVPGAVDVQRFDPEELAALRRRARAGLGLDEGHVAVGIVARIQRHRRFELLLEAFRLAHAEAPELRLVLVGRGTHAEELIDRPLAALGLSGAVIRAGYREGELYQAVLSALDLGVFMVPGSDGSCRAAREILAAGLPLLVTRRAPLPEIVGDGECGVVLDEDAPRFARAMVELARQGDRRRALARAARARAVACYSLAGQAAAVARAYARIRGLGPRGRS